MSLGTIYWAGHALHSTAPCGHQRPPGKGELLAFGPDEHGQLCGFVEADGRIIPVRLSELRRTAEALGDQQELGVG